MSSTPDSSSMPQEIGPPRRVLLVTGMLGAGKSTALNILEDLGWVTIDNLPLRLIEPLVSAPEVQPAPLAIGFDARTRGLVPQHIIAQATELAELPGVALSTLFIDCATEELERRYNETRRRHPLAQGRPLAEGIRAERDLLAPLRRWADLVIDTTAFGVNDLQQHIRELFAEGPGGPMTVTVSSFGFARGTPPLADLMFDMRFLDNPHWEDELRPLTGLDAPVAAHIRKDPGFHESFDRILDLLLTLLPRYRAQGKGYVHVAFGCTGGKHRSVYTAEAIAQGLRDAGFSPTVRHRNLGSRTTDEIEGMRR